MVWLVESENECSMEDYAKDLNINSFVEEGIGEEWREWLGRKGGGGGEEKKNCFF